MNASTKNKFRERASEIMSCTIGPQVDREYITRNLLLSEFPSLTTSYACYLARDAYKNAPPVGVVAASLMGQLPRRDGGAASRENGKRGGRPRKSATAQKGETK